MNTTECNADRDQRTEREMRNRLAKDYEARYIRDKGLWYNKVEIDSLIAALACKSDNVVLDAGSGAGRISLKIAPMVNRLVCIDFSVESLRVLLRKLQPEVTSKVQCIAADITTLPIRVEGFFDKIISAQVIQHIPAYSKRLSALEILYRLLKKGGYIVFTVFRHGGAVWTNKEDYYEGGLYRCSFKPDEIKELARKAGFKRIIVRPLIVQHLRFQRLGIKCLGIERPGIWTTHIDRFLARFLDPERFGQFLLVTAYKL